MNTSMKIYLVMHKFCNEDYDGNTMLGEEIITSFSTKETAERFVLKWSNPHSLPKPYDGIYLGELYIKELTLDSVNIDEDPHIGKDLEDYYCRDYENEEEEESEDAPSYDEHIDDEVAEEMPPHIVPGIIKCYGNSSGNIGLSPCFVDLYEMRVFNSKYSYTHNWTDESERLSVVLGTDPAGEELPVIDIDSEDDADYTVIDFFDQLYWISNYSDINSSSAALRKVKNHVVAKYLSTLDDSEVNISKIFDIPENPFDRSSYILDGLKKMSDKEFGMYYHLFEDSLPQSKRPE